MMGSQAAAGSDPISNRLRAIASECPDLHEAARYYGAILPLLRDAEPFAVPLSVTAGEARAAMEKGQPLLKGIDLQIEAASARELMFRLARAMCAEEAFPEGTPRTAAACRIEQAVEKGRLDVGSLLLHAAEGDSAAVAAAAQEAVLEPNLLWSLLEKTLRPALWEWRRQLAPLASGIPWHRGHCYICGAPSVLGELQGAARAKHLRCGRCGADWEYPRLGCLYCGNEDYRTLRVLYEEGRRETKRVEACDLCRGYLKVIAVSSPTPPELLAAEDLATVNLDFLAQEHGYEWRQGDRTEQ